MGKALIRVGHRLRAARAQVYFDISPLLEEQWTGIPIVAAGLAGAMLAALPARLQFFLGTALIDKALMADALHRRSGLFLQREWSCGRARAGTLPLLGAAAGPSLGVFPSVKQIRRAFDVECSVFHDLSTLVLPYFHIKGNVDHHMEAMMADIASDDVVAAVSQASADDLTAYLGVAQDRLLIAPNGVSWPAGFAVQAANASGMAGTEPYLLILGTREPRKNVLLVFDMLASDPSLLESHRFVFAGKMGWLEEQHALPKALEPALHAGRIVFTGFVDDLTKYKLLAGAAATLYPSLFEGFGLPVLESLSAGTPCVASWSSSIPEVGGSVCTYFDPLSATDMRRAVMALLARPPSPAACRAQASQFTWQNAAAMILDRMVGILDARLESPV